MITAFLGGRHVNGTNVAIIRDADLQWKTTDQFNGGRRDMVLFYRSPQLKENRNDTVSLSAVKTGMFMGFRECVKNSFVP